MYGIYNKIPTKDFPKTIQEAVDIILKDQFNDDALTKEFEEFLDSHKDSLIIYHMSLGRWIRNNFGLWQDNTDLMKDCNKDHPDEASFVIIEELWKQGRELRKIIRGF